MANVNEYVSIRKEPDLESEKLGILYKDCSGQLIEKGDEWSEITSGGVTGWVRNKYLYFGEEAQSVAEEVGILTMYSNTETLRVREQASLDAPVLGLLAKGEALEAIAEEGDWVSVSYEGTTGYVAAEYVTVEFSVDEAESMETIKAREAEEEAIKTAAQALASSSEVTTTTDLVSVQREAVLASASELEILAALIQCEAGGEPYEGQVAVGAVVMNRVRCPAYPDTITDVIYASGQFVPASKSRMQNLILTGTTKESCRQAALEAINGVSNVGDALYFRRVGSKSGIVIGNHVFW
jgi:flavin-binding protein dodecin